jgi:hypothetical protein
MWISSSTFETLVKDRFTAEGRATVLELENARLHATLDWLKMLTNRSEQERAQLLYNYTGVKVPVAEIAREEPAKSPLEGQVNAGLFNDMGDEEAARLGIGWDDKGELAYSERKA